MSEVVKGLRDRRLNVWEQAKSLADRASDENRAFSGEEQGQWDTLNAELDRLDSRIKNMIEGEQRAKDAEEAFSKLNGNPREQRGSESQKRDSELRQFLRGEGGRVYDVKPEQRDSTTANSAGVVPAGFYGQLWEYMVEMSGILQAGPTLLNTDGGETIKIPRVTAHSAVAAAAEATPITESDPTFGSVNLSVTKEGYLVQLSRELLDDSGVDLNGYLARAAGRALGNAVGANAATVLLAGTGAGVTGPATSGGGFGAQSTADRGFDLLISLYHSVIAPYRASSSTGWLMSDPTAAAVRKIKTTDGQYAWQPSVVVGQPDSILGKPVYIDTNIPDVAVAAESVVFGDLASLYVRIAGGFRFERSDDFAFGSDLVSFRALVRHGAVHVDPNATKTFTGGAA